MARQKNALRKHFVAAYDGSTTEPTTWLRLAKWIPTITDDTEEETESQAYYDGDGTPTTDVLSIAETWTFEGTYDSEDAAQALIAGMKRKTGEDRKIWHKIEQTDGKTFTGIGTVSAIKAGSGDASAYEEFGCTITFDTAPAEQNGTTP